MTRPVSAFPAKCLSLTYTDRVSGASAIDAGEVEGTEANRTVTHEDDLDAAADLPGAAAGLELDDEDSDWDGEDPEADLDMIVNNPERFNSPIRDLEYAEGEDLNTTRVNDNHGAQGADEGGEDMRGDVTAPFMTPGEKSRAKRQGQRHPAWLPDEHYHLMRMLKESRGKKWSREKKEEVHNQKFIGTFVDRIERGHRSLDALTQQRTKLNNAKKTLKILKAEAKEYLKDPKHTLDAEGETKAAPVDLADSDDDDDDDDEDGNEEGDTTEQATHEPDEVEQGEINALNAEGAETTEGAGKAGLAGTAVGDETTKREGDVVE